jgi:hypothetical protein
MTRKWRMVAAGVFGAFIILPAALAFLVSMQPAPGLKVVLNPEGTSGGTGVLPAVLTNTWSHKVYVIFIFLEREDRNGKVPAETVVGPGELLGGVDLEPEKSCAARFNIPDSSGRVRVTAYYSFAAGALPRFVSRYVQRLKPPTFPQRGVWGWLRDQGWVDGYRQLGASSPWVSAKSGR